MVSLTTTIVRFIGGFCTALLLLGATQPALSASITNGGFEMGDLTGWSASGNVGVADGFTNSCCVASEGQFFVDFNGGDTVPNGQLSRTFTTTLGTEYLLSFDFGKGGIGLGTAQLDVEVTGVQTLLDEIVSDSSGGLPGQYMNLFFPFIADSVSTTLTFTDTSHGTTSFDALLDNVSVAAVIFHDDFDRANGSLVGNNWSEHGGGFSGIENNRLVLDNGANENIGDNFAYIDLGLTLTGVTVSGVMQYDHKPAGGPPLSSTYYIGLNALGADILSDPSGPGMQTEGAGFGIEILPDGTLLVVDETLLPGSPLATGSHNLSELTDFNFALSYGADNSLVVTLWNVGATRPGSPTLVYMPGVSGPEPTFSGTHLTFGITDEGEIQVDEVTVSDVDLFGQTLKISPSYEFSLEQYAQKTDSIQLFNPGNVPRSATLEIVNPHPELAISLQSQDPVTIAPGATVTLPLQIDAVSVAVGVYDGILLEVVVDDGSTLYSDITVYVTEQGDAELPDLTVSSNDISIISTDPGGPVTYVATIHNRGNSPALDVTVQFYNFGVLVEETVIPEVPANGSINTSITVTTPPSGDHLVEVVIDPLEMVPELDKSNNEASQIVQPGGTSGATEGNILIIGSLPSRVYTDALFSLTGQAVYDIIVGGVRYTNYVVKGGSVEVTIRSEDGTEWVYGGIHTDVNGNFTKSLVAPSAPGTYRLFMTVTDNTLIGTRELVFTVAERPASPPPPPPPPILPTSGGTGEWTFDGVAWNWTWISPPTSGPVPESDVRVFSEDIHFSKDNPDAEEEITVFAEIHYWATSTVLVAKDIPVNFYATLPGSQKELIGQTVIPSLSLAVPENGSRYVYATWKNPGEGIYIIEVEIDPSWVEENMLNNAATRAILVGELASNQGAISGEVTNAWGGVDGVIINAYDASGLFLGSTVTEETGFYLFESIPAGGAEIRIETPASYVADVDTKTVNVDANSVTQDVDFSLTEQVVNQPPIADPGGPYSGIPGSPIGFDGSGSYDPDGGDIAAYEWDFGDGSTGTGVFPTHTYAVAGSYTVTLTVVDDEDVRSTPATQTVTVEDTTPPVVTVPADITEEATGPSGATVSFTATATDAVDGDLTPTCAPASGSTFPLGTTTVTCTATDAAGNSANASFNVLVHQPPVADPNGPYLVAVGESVTLDGSASYDPDGNPLTETWTAEGGTVEGNLYTAGAVPGIYDVTLMVNDGLADSKPASTTVVVYDPEGGFVTGGGWIDSEPGWCQLDDLCAGAEGKANFGFVSKYRKGATVPTGETEFNFEAGGLNFHSDSYDWLVVNQGGTNAQYKGSATINGESAPSGELYRFMLWANDLSPSADDTFRIKIWYEDEIGTEVVVYDNGFDQPIGSGSIIVHTAKVK